MARESIAARLTALREGKGLTKYRLAKISGVSQTYIYRIERGEIKNPRRDTLQALAAGLNVTLAYLIGEPAPLDTLQLVEQSLKAYIPVYAEVGEEGEIMAPVDYVACTRTRVPPPTLRAYRASCLYPSVLIEPTDTVVVDTALTPENGDLVVVIKEGQPTVKKYRQDRKGQKWFEDGKDRVEVEDVTIHGIITEFIRKMR